MVFRAFWFSFSGEGQKQPSIGVPIKICSKFLKICSKFTGEYLCRSVTSIKLLSNFIEITLRHGCSHVNMQHIFRTPFRKNTSGGLLLEIFPQNLGWYLQPYRYIQASGQSYPYQISMSKKGKSLTTKEINLKLWPVVNHAS